MQRVFGEKYPEKGVVLAMGAHSLYPETGLINGVARLNASQLDSLFQSRGFLALKTSKLQFQRAG